MNESGVNGEDPVLDARLERSLTHALHAEPLGPDALARIRTAAAREWQLSTGKGDRRIWVRRSLWGSMAAVVCILALGVVWFESQSADSAVFGVLIRSDAGDANVRFEIVRWRVLRVGGPLRAGDTLTTHGPALIALSSGGTLRLAADTVVEVSGEAEARLQRGLIYVDLPAGTASKSPFRVVTRAGTIEHLGTEFEVLSSEQVVRLRVREGRVRLRNRAEEFIAEAGTELTADRTGGVSRSSISSYGRDWLWVAALAPDCEIEGRPLLGFLEWASRELGRPLEFSDAHAREVAERTILHGSVRGREPLDALASVLATTTLSYEIRGSTIWIQSGHGT
jgi:hypothetical protein